MKSIVFQCTKSQIKDFGPSGHWELKELRIFSYMNQVTVLIKNYAKIINGEVIYIQ